MTMYELVLPPNLSMQGLNAFFTTKDTAFADLSELLERELNVKADIFMPIQKHTNTVHLLEKDHEPVTADAVITSEKNVLIGIKVADCVPILLYDKARGVIAAVHAGWRGTAGGILINTLEAMSEAFGSMPGDILAAVGPSIKGCSYEVDEEVKSLVMKTSGDGGYFKKAGDKYLLDLPLANKVQAMSAGMSEDNIWLSDECTFCSPHKYHSYRRSASDEGRQGGFIVMC